MNDPNPGIERRALKERWPITDEQRAAIIQNQARIAAEDDGVAAVKAFRALIAADAVNIGRPENSTEASAIGAVSIKLDPGVFRQYLEGLEGPDRVREDSRAESLDGPCTPPETESLPAEDL